MTVATLHYCYGVDYAPDGIMCMCARGEDHGVNQFDVPKEED